MADHEPAKSHHAGHGHADHDPALGHHPSKKHSGTKHGGAAHHDGGTGHDLAGKDSKGSQHSGAHAAGGAPHHKKSGGAISGHHGHPGAPPAAAHEGHHHGHHAAEPGGTDPSHVPHGHSAHHGLHHDHAGHPGPGHHETGHHGLHDHADGTPAAGGGHHAAGHHDSVHPAHDSHHGGHHPDHHGHPSDHPSHHHHDPSAAGGGHHPHEHHGEHHGHGATSGTGHPGEHGAGHHPHPPHHGHDPGHPHHERQGSIMGATHPGHRHSTSAPHPGHPGRGGHPGHRGSTSPESHDPHGHGHGHYHDGHGGGAPHHGHHDGHGGHPGQHPSKPFPYTPTFGLEPGSTSVCYPHEYYIGHPQGGDPICVRHPGHHPHPDNYHAHGPHSAEGHGSHSPHPGHHHDPHSAHPHHQSHEHHHTPHSTHSHSAHRPHHPHGHPHEHSDHPHHTGHNSHHEGHPHSAHSGHHHHHGHPHDESAQKFSEHAGMLLTNYDHLACSKPWTPRYSGRDTCKSPLSTWGASPGQYGSSTERLQESLELELSRRRHCEKMIGCIQATLLEANEEVVALAEQSRRREQVLCEKEEKIRTQHLEHCNMENFLRGNMEEASTKYRNLSTEFDQARNDWRSNECGSNEKIAELEIRVKTLKDELRHSKHRLSEYEAERHRLQCTVKEAEQELCRVKSCHQSEKAQLEGSKREYKKRMEKLMVELDGMKKYVECQERKCSELEDRLTRSESQLDGAMRNKAAVERELADQCATQQTSLHEITRSLRIEYEAKMAENDKQCRREIDRITKGTNRRTEHEVEKLREEIRCDFEEKIARLKVDYKLKESNYEKQVARMVDKMRQYECRLEGIVRDKEREDTDCGLKTLARRRSSLTRSKSDWRDTCDKYTGDGKWRSDYGTSDLKDSTLRTLNNAKSLLDDCARVSSPKRFVIHGTYTPRRSPRRSPKRGDYCSSPRPDSGRRSCSAQKSYFS